MPPSARPFPRFIADSSVESEPNGRWAERLTEQFAAAAEPLAGESGSPLDVSTIRWFPERAWGGRTYVPVTGRAAEPSVPADAPEGSEPVLCEYFGWISFVQDGDQGEP